MKGTRIALIALAAVVAGIAVVQVTEVRPRPEPRPEDILRGMTDTRASHCRAIAQAELASDPAALGLPPGPYEAALQARIRRCLDQHR